MPTSLSKYLDPTGLDETVINIRQLTEALEAEMQELPYARPDGIYPDMTVGAVIGADETAQWATRESTGNGGATVRSVQGAAVAFNQMIAPRVGTVTQNGVTFVVSADGSIVANGTAEGSAATSLVSVRVLNGHKYLFKGCPQGGTADTYGIVLTGNSSIIPANNWDYGAGNMVTAASDGDAIMIAARVAVNYTANNLVFYPMLFDLTQMFGSGNEPTTVAEFERMYPESYYPYSAPTLKPVQIAGIESTDAQGGELDSVEWPTQTLRAAGSVADMLYSDHVDINVGVVDLGVFNWVSAESLASGYFYTATDFSATNQLTSAPYINQKNLTNWGNTTQWPSPAVAFNVAETGTVPSGNCPRNRFIVYDPSAAGMTAEQFKAHVDGVVVFYGLVTPTTPPISPALPMTYKVQQGGSESVIVPDGEVSAAPVLTIAEPVNMSTELARIWAAIESLGYTRNAAQLSRPVSLTDTVSIDETQKDTTDIAEIDTTKEVQE